jgi:Phorbol esters/diacylglycerol binding domain (C1 domain)
MFLGHVTIPLAPVIHYKTTNRIYTLTSLDDDSEFNTGSFMKEPRKAKNSAANASQPQEELRQHVPKQTTKRYREFLKFLENEQLEARLATSQKQHVFVEKTFAGSTCNSCQSMMVGTQLYCSECKFVCHLKCNEDLPPICGGKGAIRLKLEIRRTVVLKLPYYIPIIDLMLSHDYQILIAYGKFSTFREDIARRFIKILDSEDGLEFIKSIVVQEINNSEDSRTLFRANSLATKALDVYMKAVGTGII